MRRHSVIVWQSVLAAIALIASACSSPSTAPPPQSTAGSGTNAAPAAAQPTAAPAQVKVEMRFAWWGSQDRHNRTIKAIELFEQQHPNITFTYEFDGFS